MTKRPLFIIAVFLVLGEFLASYSENMAFAWMAGTMVPAVFLFIIRKKKNGYGERLLFILPLAGILGGCLYLSESRPDALLVRYGQADERPRVVAEGEADWIQERENGCYVYIPDALVTWNGSQYDRQGVVWSCSGSPGLVPGDRVRLEGELLQFPRASNPGEFDSYSYYRAKGYCYLLRTQEYQVIQRGRGWRQMLWGLRQRMKDNVAQSAMEEDAGIFEAIFLGEAGMVDEETRTLFQEQGIAHLLAISGLHISIVGMTVYRICRRLTGSYGAAGILGGIFVAGYGFVTGGSISCQRAVLMYLVQTAAFWRGRVYDTGSSLGIAVLWLACRYPLAAGQAPFLLSCSAVLGLSLLSDMWQAFLLQRDRRGVLPMLALQQGMLPVLLFFYYQYPLFSVPINQLALPLGGLLIGAAAGCACLPPVWKPLGRAFGRMGHLILVYYRQLCRLFAQIPQNRQINGKPADWRILCFLLLLLGLAMVSDRYNRMKKRRYSPEAVIPGWRRRLVLVHLAAGLLLCFEAWFLRADPTNRLVVTMLDVGQGDGCLIQIPGGIHLLSDAGSTSRQGLAEYTLEPVLKAKGISRLDGILVSHSDQDHVNGIQELLERGEITAGFVALPDYESWKEDFRELIDTAEKRGCQILRLGQGEGFALGEAKIHFLHPEKGEQYSDVNASSLVFTLEYGSFTMLFTGDIGAEEEMEVVGGVDLLKVPHHGSRFSTTSDWLAQLAPRAAVISCSADNRYGHPHAEVLKRLQEAGADCYLTMEEGAVIIETDGNGFTVTGYGRK